jgi:TonB family protein
LIATSFTPARIRVGPNPASAAKQEWLNPDPILKVAPIYPPLAEQAHIEGIVRLKVTIGNDGRVIDMQLISGPPLLRQAAKDAVEQWIYEPREGIALATVKFTLP